MKIQVRIIDDENEEIWAGDKYITHLSHDEHGWNGMSAVREMVEELAKVLGIEFETIYVE